MGKEEAERVGVEGFTTSALAGPRRHGPSLTWDFPKMGGTLFWGPYNTDPAIWGSILGSPIFGNPHIIFSGCFASLPASLLPHPEHCWVAAKEFKLSCYNKETLVFAIHTYILYIYTYIYIYKKIYPHNGNVN